MGEVAQEAEKTLGSCVAWGLALIFTKKKKRYFENINLLTKFHRIIITLVIE